MPVCGRRGPGLLLALTAVFGGALPASGAGGCPTAVNRVEKRPATLANLIQTALRYGSAWQYMGDRSSDSQALRYEAPCSPDSREHMLFVKVLRGDGRSKPLELYWLSNEWSQGIEYAAHFRTDLRGKLLSAVLFVGPDGKHEQTTLDAGSEAAKKLYKKEADFFLKGSGNTPFRGQDAERGGSYEPWQAN